MRILLLNQAFYPDVVSTAQYLADLARGLIERGDEVTVVCGDRGYDDRHTRFSRAEVWNGVRIIRVPSLGFGKNSRWRRILDFGSFLVCTSFKLSTLRRFDVVICLTSPPFISLVGALFTKLKGGRLVSWVMDLNPDEAIAAGWVKPSSIGAKILKAISRRTFEWSDHVIVLDRFMRERLLGYGVQATKISVIPPWAQDDSMRFDEAGRERFRELHGLRGKFVIMYSGNHSPCHPLDTLLQAALQLAGDRDVHFCFVGGGSGMNTVKAFKTAHALDNITCLPYQPRNSLSASLSAADLHVVVMGNAFVGIVHPCKIYNALAVGLPVLYIGPSPSHIEELAAESGWTSIAGSVRNGDVSSAVNEICAASRNRHSSGKLSPSLSKSTLLPRFIDAAVPPTLSAAATPSRFNAPASANH